MSRQRARMNCRRCYDLGNSAPIDEKSLQLRGSGAFNQHVWEIRNEAMKALEEEIGGIDSSQRSNSSMGPRVDAENALDKCLNCNYDCPRIDEHYQEVLRENDGSV